MKAITFNQLQLRLLTFLFLLFTTSVFSYRYFIELPKLEQSIAKLSERELDILKFSIASKLDAISRASFDYAVWTSTYNFIRDRDDTYIDENIVTNTFVSMKIDGIFYLDEQLVPILTRGFHRSGATEVNFSFYNFEKYPENVSLLPSPIIGTGAPTKFGFIDTRYGPAMYGTTQIRDSSMQGENRGFLIMIQLLEEEFVDTLSKQTLTKITFVPIPTGEALQTLRNWNQSTQNLKIAPYSDISLRGAVGTPITVLRMKHSVSKIPSLFNAQSYIFIILMSLFIYLVYRLISVAIITPVKKLADDLKERDNSHRYKPLADEYKVAELAIVSKNINTLIATVQDQNNILSKQANTDQLTNILNRRGLFSAMEVQKEFCFRNNIGFVVVMADIDHFKLYNDSVGHIQGDIALVEVAKVLNMQCQRSGDICGRYGGEEFIMLFGDMGNQDLNRKLNKMIQAMQALGLEHPSSPTANYITVSIGVVVIKPSEVIDFTISLKNIFRVADNALYEAKHSGRNCFVIKGLVN